MSKWITEHILPGYRIQVESEEKLAASEEGSPFGIQLHQVSHFGKTLYMGDHFMTSEKDEFVYHELMVHPGLIEQDSPKQVLIIGGGDGGAIEEVLKHQSITKVTLVEIDDQVINLSKQYLQSINKNCFDDSRVNVVITDGYDFIVNHFGKEVYDAIILDLTDPEGPAERLYSEEYFMKCKELLTKNGKFTFHLGSAWTDPERVKRFYNQAKRVFKRVDPYMAFVPLYGTLWTFAVCEKNDREWFTKQIEEEFIKRNLQDLKYYTPQIHNTMFVLPKFVEDLLKN